MTKPFDTCSLADFVHELQLAARDASGSALSADVVTRITPCLLDHAHTQAVLLRHPRVGFGSSGLACSAAADSKQAWCSMLRDLFLGAGVSVSDAALLRVYLVVKQCANLGRVRLPQEASPVAVVQFNMRSGGGFEKQFAYANGQSKFEAKTEGGSFQNWGGFFVGGDCAMRGNIDVGCCVLNSVCARMRGGSLESLRLLDYQQDMQCPAHAVEIASGRWCLQLFAAAEQLHGARVFLRVCNAEGEALVRIQLAPAAQRLHLRTLVPVYEMTMGHMQRLRGMGCGGRGKLALLMSQGGLGGGPVPRDGSALMDCIVRRVAAAQVELTLEGMHAKAEALSAKGEHAAAAAKLQRAIDLGNLPSRALKAWLLIDGRESVDMLIQGRECVVDDEKRAFELVEEGARLGCHHCQGVMAYCYRSGHGCEEDEARSLELARESSGRGSRYGQYTLGELHYYGEGGLAQDYAQAVALYRLAAAQSLEEAQHSLGYMYYSGFGVARDYTAALRWYQLAAAQGHSMPEPHVQQW